LIYKSYYDYKSKLLHVFPAYRITNSTKAIDAHTGEVVDLYYGYSRLVAMTGDAMDAGGMGSSESENLSREELEAIEKLGKLLTKEDAISKITEQIPLPMKNTDMGRASLRKDIIDQDKYIWEIYFDNMYGSVDARTGELLSYGYYGDDAGGKLNLTKDAARKIAENLLQKVAPQKVSESKYIPDYNEDIIIFREEEKPAAYTFRYNRVINGVI
jgi:hypothetical protein